MKLPANASFFDERYFLSGWKLLIIPVGIQQLRLEKSFAEVAELTGFSVGTIFRATKHARSSLEPITITCDDVHLRSLVTTV